MYTIFLTIRYLTRKKIVIFPILVVWLCVMMLIIVTSIMGGFVERVRSANRDLFGDIIVSSASSSQGFAQYDALAAELKAKFPNEIEATTPVVEAYSLIYAPYAQRSLPALLVGIEPEGRSRVSKFQDSLFQQHKMPARAVEEFESKLPATNAKLLEDAYASLAKITAEQRAARRFAQDIQDGYIHFDVAYVRLLWIVVPAAAFFLLWIRARRKRKVLAFVLPIVVGVFGIAIVVLAAIWPVLFRHGFELALDHMQQASAEVDVAERNCDMALKLLERGLEDRVAQGALTQEAADTLRTGLRMMDANRRRLFHMDADIADLKIQSAALEKRITSGSAEPRMKLDLAAMKDFHKSLEDVRPELQTQYEQQLKQFNEHLERDFVLKFSKKEDLAKAIVPTQPSFKLPSEIQGPQTGAIVGSQIGFFKRDTRGNFIHPYPFNYPQVTITVFPPSKSGNINVRGTNAVSQEFTLVDTSHSGVFDVDSTNVYAPFETVQMMAGMRPDPGLGAEGHFEPRCHQLLIKLKANALPKMRLLRAKMNDTVTAFTKKNGDPIGFEGLLVQTWDEKQARYLGAVQNEKTMMTFILLLMSGVVLVVIFLIFYQIVRDKTRDIGIIKAVGGSEAGVAAIFLAYGLMIGIVGGGLGVLSGVLFVTHTNEIHELIFQTTGHVIWDRSVYLFDRIPDVVNPWDCVIYFAVALIAGVLGALIPAILAAFEDPVQAVRFE